MRPLNRAATLVVSAVLMFGSSLAASPADERNRSAGDRVREVLPPSEVVFTQQERVLVGSWIRDNRGKLPPGLAKRDRLPPGLEKQLRERGTLPPGLQKKLHPLPPTLESRMRRLPTAYRRAVIGGNVVLMNEQTAVIYDIIRNTIP